jgi:hypothetical protein
MECAYPRQNPGKASAHGPIGLQLSQGIEKLLKAMTSNAEFKNKPKPDVLYIEAIIIYPHTQMQMSGASCQKGKTGGGVARRSEQENKFIEGVGETWNGDLLYTF